VKTIPVPGDPNCGAVGRAFWLSGYTFARAQPCPATTYATPPPGAMAGVNRRVVAHEVSHLGHLFHLTGSADNDNLMFTPWSSAQPELRQSKLEWWQIAALRSSRYCSYF